MGTTGSQAALLTAYDPAKHGAWRGQRDGRVVGGHFATPSSTCTGRSPLCVQRPMTRNPALRGRSEEPGPGHAPWPFGLNYLDFRGSALNSEGGIPRWFSKPRRTGSHVAAARWAGSGGWLRSGLCCGPRCVTPAAETRIALARRLVPWIARTRQLGVSGRHGRRPVPGRYRVDVPGQREIQIRDPVPGNRE